MRNIYSTISNLAFPISTIYIIDLYDAGSLMAYYVLICSILLAFGSWMYHSTTRGHAARETATEYRWRKADEVGMYAFFNALFGLFVWALAGFTHAPFIMVATLLITICMGVFHRGFDSTPELGQFFFQILILALVTSGYLNGEYWQPLYALFFATLAYGLRQLGEHAATGIKKSTAHDLLHAAWHIEMAVSFALFQSIVYMAI